MKSIWKEKKWLPAAGIVCIAAALLFTQIPKGEAKEEEPRRLREYTATFGDITVGVGTTGKAKMKEQEYSFISDGKVDSVFVKAGQKVKKGDPLISLSKDQVLEAVNKLQREMEKAHMQYEQAMADQEIGVLQAKRQLDEAQGSDKSDKEKELDRILLENNIKELQYQLNKQRNTLAKLQKDLRYGNYLMDDDSALYRQIKRLREQIEGIIKGLEAEHANLAPLKEEIALLEQDWKDLNVVKQRMLQLEEEIAELKKQLGQGNDAEVQAQIDAKEKTLNDLKASFDEAGYSKLSVKIAEKKKKLQEALDAIDDEELKDAQTMLAELEQQLKEEQQTNGKQTKEELIDKIAEAQFAIDKTSLEIEVAKIKRDKATSSAIDDDGLSQKIYDNTISKLQQSLDLAKLAVDTLTEEIEEAKAFYIQPTLYAKEDGVVLEVTAAAGKEIQRGVIAMRVGSLSAMQLGTTVMQSDLQNVEVGQEVEIFFEAYPNVTVKGVVDSIQYIAEQGNDVLYQVWISIVDTKVSIYEGMTAEATIISKQKKDVLYIANKAIINEEGKMYVQILQPDGTFIKTRVQTGFSDGKYTEVVSGMEAGQIAVVEVY